MEACADFIVDPTDTFYKERRFDSIQIVYTIDNLECVCVWVNKILQKNSTIRGYPDESFTIKINEFFIHVNTKEGTYVIDRTNGTKYITVRFSKQTLSDI